MLPAFNLSLAALMLMLCILYLARFRSRSDHVYSPPAAWLRAGIYFCACFLLCWLTGTQAMLLATPLAWPDQVDDPGWIVATAGITLLIFVAYWGIWARYTLRFERRLHLVTQVSFGLVWGASAGQLIVTVWHVLETAVPELAQWQLWLGTWFIAGSWHWWFHDFYWDLKVAPEHDTPFSIVLKTVLLHIPQTALCTLYLVYFGNPWILIGLQTIALLAAAIFMRMPPWWSKDPTPAARPHPFLFGLQRGGGYLSPDPASDPYLKAAHSPPRNSVF